MAPQPEQPNHGMRVTLDRTRVDDDATHYTGELRAADGEIRRVAARIGAAIEVRVDDGGEALDAPVLRYLEGLCRQIATGGRKEGVWPRRVRRWRELDAE